MAVTNDVRPHASRLSMLVNHTKILVCDNRITNISEVAETLCYLLVGTSEHASQTIEVSNH